LKKQKNQAGFCKLTNIRTIFLLISAVLLCFECFTCAPNFVEQMVGYMSYSLILGILGTMTLCKMSHQFLHLLMALHVLAYVKVGFSCSHRRQVMEVAQGMIVSWLLNFLKMTLCLRRRR